MLCTIILLRIISFRNPLIIDRGEKPMSSNYYNRIETEDTYNGMPKKRFSLLGLLSKIRNLCFLILLLIVIFTAWSSLHNESYMSFRLIIGLIFNKEIFSLVVSSFMEGFEIQPIARSIELLGLVVCVWKLIFRGKILAFIRIKSIVMLSLASYWLYLLLFLVLNCQSGTSMHPSSYTVLCSAGYIHWDSMWQ